MRKVYLDHNATTPLDPRVCEAMMPYCRGDIFGNASSVHSFGRQAKKSLEDSRSKIASFINAKSPDEIVFTGSGTEADNFAIKGIADILRSKGNHIITSQIEHHAVLNPCNYLEKHGFKVTYLSVDRYGVVDLEQLKDVLGEKTVLVSIMYANNEVGTIQPIEEIAKIVKKRGVLFHTDAVQVAGKMPIDVQRLDVDLLSISAHKLYGPKGVGALYVRKGVKLTPLLHGGHHELNRRAGTENVSGIVGFAKSAEIAKAEMDEYVPRIERLRERLQKGILKKIKYAYLNGHPDIGHRICNTLNISFEYVEGESIILNLDMEGVAVSTGSACTSGSLEPSHVLKAMGVDPVKSQGSIRFSLGKGNTKEDIDYVLEVLPPIIERLRKMSPLYKE